MDKTRLRKIIVTILIVAVVLGYDISPLDIVPDVMVGVGQLDDIAISVLGALGVALNWILGKKNNDTVEFKEL